MKTGSFFSYAGPGRISIARSAPRTAGFEGFKVFRPLAPGGWFNSVDEQTYRQLYFQQLAQLDPAAVVKRLEELAGGVEPVLLCYELPKDIAAGKTFCHRRMAAEWFLDRLGLVVEELP